ncbi:MAG: Sensor histidine kinase RcsC [Chroococcopsis gigantea SAG 12.99]|jgi:chemotaxis family two-component system sensor histidine kinase/response regulator PixL|nr:hybrid sensor histidine kinase/response regulator [Chlorogloea purpurea SAG 13.99]MDV3001883.1 Sensor histidine kinase RcsC [Chroococcopsis gigantea SAG 12.99]
MLNPDIRDQAYQFFIEEAAELLQSIETGLLTLKAERSKGKVHEIMRAAHSLKGGSASVELHAIRILSHRLEDYFKALYHDEIIIDDELESLLLNGFDCLKYPLLQQIETGYFDQEKALNAAEPVFNEIEMRLAPVLSQGHDYIPSSEELGVDITASLFEVDVAGELERLEAVLADQAGQEIAGELRATAEVFDGFGEMLNLPGWSAISHAVLDTLTAYPHQARAIAHLACENWRKGRDAVLNGDRTDGGAPSPAWQHFNGSEMSVSKEEEASLHDVFSSLEEFANLDDVFGAVADFTPTGDRALDDVFGALDGYTLPDPIALEEVFGNGGEISGATTSAEDTTIELPPSFIPFTRDTVEEFTAPTVGSLEDIFGSFDLSGPTDEAPAPVERSLDIPTVEEVFGKDDSPAEVIGANLDLPTVEEVFGSETNPIDINDLSSIDAVFNASLESVLEGMTAGVSPEQEAINQTIAAIAKDLESLPSVEELPDNNFTVRPLTPPKEHISGPEIEAAADNKAKVNTPAPSALSVRVDFNRLERMNNLVGELSINRNSLSLQNSQLQAAVKELLNRFQRFENLTDKLRQLSDKMLINPIARTSEETPKETGGLMTGDVKFDALEMDRYNGIQEMVTGLLEEMMQLGESVDDIVLFARGSNQTLESQRQMVTSIRDELMWARMLPLREVLNRFPRVLRDLASTYGKQVKLKLTGTGVLVDKAALEKLYDPLMHLLRNAFDHGIESPEVRREKGRAETGEIEIHAYHQGNQTIIEIKDDGQGLNFDKISATALKNGLVNEAKLATMSRERLAELIFEPGFSTADRVTQLSGRGVGLDVVRDQLRSLKGSVSVATNSAGGATFTLRLPLTLTIAKLLVCLIAPGGSHSTAVALPSDAIEEIIIPAEGQVKISNNQRFLHFGNDIIPIYPLHQLLEYRSPLTESFSTKALAEVVSSPDEWGLPLLLLRHGQQMYAVEVNRLVSEQELVIKPFGSAIAPPGYSYGCTILGDGTLIPVINGIILLEAFADSSTGAATPHEPPLPAPVGVQAPLILVVDDSTALRRTLALTLEKAGYRVVQARDGREALEQLHQTSDIALVICDVEMPNMNGFEFLGQRRREPELAHIPVAMLTSRGSDKHRQLAMQLGAKDYFTKPYIEQQFLTSVKNLVGTGRKQEVNV